MYTLYHIDIYLSIRFLKKSKQGRKRLFSITFCLVRCVGYNTLLVLGVGSNYTASEIFLIGLVLDISGVVYHRSIDKSGAALLGNGKKRIVVGVASEVYSGSSYYRIELSVYLERGLAVSSGRVPHNVGAGVDVT